MKLDDFVIEKPESTWFLCASDDSMIWAGAQVGDILIVDRGAVAGSVLVVIAEDDLK